MKKALVLFAVSAIPAAVPVEVDRICRGQFCQVLAVQGGVVKFIDETPPAPRTLVLGPYLSSDQRLVPRTEAPIRDVRSPGGWRIVISACFTQWEYPSRLRLRFFDRAGSLWATHDALMTLEAVEVGHLFGDADEVFAITSNEEHAYNSETEIWYLPEQGNPKQVLKVLGGLGAFDVGAAGKLPGVMIGRQTYDGVHAETKGTVKEFYAWNREMKSLTPPAHR